MSQHNDDPIEGEYTAAGEPDAEPKPTTAVTERREAPPPAVFNPMGADPAQLRQQMQVRQENRINLREWLLANLMPGRDFGAVHTAKKCDNKYSCTNPYHYSEDGLFDSGAEVVRTILGLGARYPDMAAYRQAALQGVKIADVIITCELIDQHGRPVTEATGAATTKEHQDNLHNTLIKAQKRARVNAVKELPTVRTLFHGMKTLPPKLTGGVARTLYSTEAQQTPTKADLEQSKRTSRQRDERAPERRAAPATGTVLESLPFKVGNYPKGTPFSQLDGKLLAWILEKMDGKPDMTYTARVELDRRRLQAQEMQAEPGAMSGDTDDDFYDDPLPRVGEGTQAPAADVSRRPAASPTPSGSSLFDDGPPIDNY